MRVRLALVGVVVAATSGTVVGATFGRSADVGTRGADRVERVARVERLMWDRYATGPRTAIAAADEPAAITDMIAHHTDAIDGARALLTHRDVEPAVRAFAERIIRVQTDQVATMESFLTTWYPGTRDPSHWVPMFSDPATTATSAAFLATMIEHHEHAIVMYAGWVAAGLVAHDDLGLLAARIAKGQEGEIATMRQLTASLDQAVGTAS